MKKLKIYFTVEKYYNHIEVIVYGEGIDKNLFFEDFDYFIRWDIPSGYRVFKVKSKEDLNEIEMFINKVIYKYREHKDSFSELEKELKKYKNRVIEVY